MYEVYEVRCSVILFKLGKQNTSTDTILLTLEPAAYWTRIFHPFFELTQNIAFRIWSEINSNRTARELRIKGRVSQDGCTEGLI
jgi:hypothetical protein